MDKIRKNSQKGQILLLVVLAAVISLTVGLAAVSRTITNTKISTEEANSQKALSAAEAGVEQLVQDNSLVSQQGTGGKFTGNLGGSTFTATITNVAGTQILIDGGKIVSANDGVDVWLSDHSTYANPTNANLTLYWNDASDDDCTQVEVVVIWDTTAGNGSTTDAPGMQHYAYDKCGNNNFNSGVSVLNPAKAIQNKTFNRKLTTSIVVTRGLIARIIPYSDTPLAVESSVNLPAQGYVIDSQGTSGSTTRKIRAYQSYPKLPTELFPYTLFEP